MRLLLLGLLGICCGTLPAAEFKMLPERPLPDDEIVYKKTAAEDLKFHIYRPVGWRPSDRRPVLLMFHGGGWRGGDPGQFSEQCRAYAELGFVAVTASYRLARKGDLDSYFNTVRDARSAVRYAKTHSSELGIDPAKIITAGSSAGGHLAIATAVLDSLNDPADDLSIDPAPAAVLLFCPGISTGPPPPKNSFYPQFPEHYREFSPAENLKKGMPPQLILLGTEDHLLSEAEAEAYREKCRALENRCELVMFEGAKHGAFYRGRFVRESLKPAIRFLTELELMPAKE